MNLVAVSLCLQLCATLVQIADAQYQWSCSSLDASSQFYLPDLPIASDESVAGDGTNLFATDSSVVYIFPVSPSINCTGMVSEIRYCYMGTNSQFNKEQLVFTLLVLDQNGLDFSITEVIAVHSTPRQKICTGVTVNDNVQFCCDALGLKPFLLPSSGFAFGIAGANSTTAGADSFGLLSYAEDRFSQFLVKHYRPNLFEFPTTTVGNTYTVTNETMLQEDRTLRLFQFVIIEPSAETSGAVGGIAGGVIVAVAVMVVLLVVCVVIVVVLKRRRSQKSPKKGRDVHNNAISESEIRYEDVRSDYAGTGPHAYSEVEDVPTAHVPQDNEPSKGPVGALGMDNNVYESVRLSLSYEPKVPENDENIYVVPGKNENTLYEQINSIMTEHIARDTVILGDKLGSGQFGTVYKGVWQSCTRGEVEVAVKTLKERSEKGDKVKFLQEAAIMAQFKDDKVVEMYGVVTQGESVLLVLELLMKGDLRKCLLNMRSIDQEGVVSVDGHTLLSYCRQVASGMAYLSSKAFVHRDLAARNILVSEDGICKIADFGMSRDLMDESYYVSHGGQIPVKWTAPEALHYKKYSTASDVWSYGALMYEIWSVGHKPFDKHTNTEVLKMVDRGYRLPPPPGCPRALYTIMMSCWHPKTSKRPDFTAISLQLSLPDSELLKWTEEDKSTHPEVDKLGANLLHAQDLYRDLQVLYST